MQFLNLHEEEFPVLTSQLVGGITDNNRNPRCPGIVESQFQGIYSIGLSTHRKQKTLCSFQPTNTYELFTHHWIVLLDLVSNILSGFLQRSLKKKSCSISRAQKGFPGDHCPLANTLSSHCLGDKCIALHPRSCLPKRTLRVHVCICARTDTRKHSPHSLAALHPACMGHRFCDNTAPTGTLLENTKKAPPPAVTRKSTNAHTDGKLQAPADQPGHELSTKQPGVFREHAQVP